LLRLGGQGGGVCDVAIFHFSLVSFDHHGLRSTEQQFGSSTDESKIRTADNKRRATCI